MQKLIILHSNDIHGRIDGLARIATLIERVRAENPDIPVLYLDAGDSEETAQRLSNLTKGVAMYHLLKTAGCAASTLGNGGISRYSHHILPDYARTASFPLLLANLRNPDGSLLPGVQATTILDVGTLKLGLIGVTDPAPGGESFYEQFFGLKALPFIPLIRELRDELLRQGADIVMLLSHLGLPNDVMLTLEISNLIPLIIGGHTHNLIPAGVWSGKTLIAQAGQFAEHLGRLDLAWDGASLQVERVSVIPVTEDIPLAESVQKERGVIEAEVEQVLNSVVGELAAPLDFACDRECGTANLLADALRTRMGTEVAVVTAAMAPTESLPAGPLKRLTLWDACPSPANPGVAELSGAQLLSLIERGLDPVLAAECTRANRGKPRGLMHLSGARMRDGQLSIGEQPVEPERVYKVAGSDWELGTFGGYASADWKLKPTYEVQAIMRDVLEDYLKDRGPVTVEMGRI